MIHLPMGKEERFKKLARNQSFDGSDLIASSKAATLF